MTDPTDAPAAEKAPADSWQMAATKELFVHGFLEPDEDHGLEAAAGIIAKHAPPSPGVPADDVLAQVAEDATNRIHGAMAYMKTYMEPAMVKDIIAKALASHPALRAALEAAAPATPEGERVLAATPKTADGTPITFGMSVWYFDEEADPPKDARWDSRGDYVETKVNAIYAVTFDSYKGEVTVGVARNWEGGNKDVWSSREAAMASHAK